MPLDLTLVSVFLKSSRITLTIATFDYDQADHYTH